jgi:glycosyltransferase involved in cell wall biosynthesis
MKESMKVALSVSVVQRGKSGVATYVFGLLRGLSVIGWPVEIVLFGLENDRELFTPWLDRCRWVPVHERFRSTAKNIAWHHLLFRRALKEHECDLVHIPSYRRIVAAPGVPQVATIHDCAPFRLAGKYDFFRTFYRKQIVTRLARHCTRIIAVSKATAADIRTYFKIPDERLRVVYNGIDHARFRRLSQEEVRKRLPQTEAWSDAWWLYVARLEHPGKNHLRLIQAYELATKRVGRPIGNLVLAGADWHGAREIHAAAEASPLRDCIIRTGFVPDDDLPAWYSGAKALVFPSLFEGFGLPTVEAMACGCPVLCSDRGSLREVVADAALIFNPENVEEMANAIVRVATDPAERARLVEKGLARSSNFRWECCAEQTVAIYKEALKQVS